MDSKVRKEITKQYIKELPVWEYLDTFMVELHKLEHSIDKNREAIRETSDRTDDLLKLNTTGKLQIRAPKKKQDSDIVKLYRKNEAGECIIRDQNKDNDVTRIGKDLVPTNKLVLDSTINSSIKLLEQRPQEGEEVFAMIEENKPWVRCKIKYVYHKPVNRTKVTAFKLRILSERRLVEVSKYAVARTLNHGDKLRVPKRVIAGPTEDNLKPGIMGQEPCNFNNFRYLVLMDDGTAQYFRPEQVYPTLYQSVIPWRDYRQLGQRNPHLEAELSYFFKTYPRRSLMKVHSGQKIELFRNGLILSAFVLSFDCDTMKVVYKDRTEESIYRGTACSINRREKVSQLLSNDFSFEDLFPKLPGNMKRYNDAGVLALGEGYLNFVENFDSKLSICGPNTARKSTASKSSDPPRFKVKFDTGAVEDDRDTKPRLADLVEKFKSHSKCGPECLNVPALKTESSVEDIIAEFRNVSDLKVPLLLGWKRILVSQVARNRPKYVYIYQAPCGRILQNIYTIRRFLTTIGSKLDIDYFTFDRDVDLNRNAIDQEAFVFEENVALEKSTKSPLENKHVSLMNHLDEETLPLDFEYRSKTFPHPMLREKNFTFNDDFKSGCDCEDDCNVRSTCACHRLNEEAFGTNAHNRGTIDKKCQYKEKRLASQVSTGIFECNSFCSCSSKCPNRVVQNGIRFRLQVQRTKFKGWGVVTLDDIPAGAFISTYSAELLDDADLYGDCDMYFADLDYITVVEQQKLAIDNNDNSDEGVDLDEDDEDDNFVQRHKRKTNGKRPMMSNIISDDDSDDDDSPIASPAADFEEFMPSTAQVSKSRYPKRNQARNGNGKPSSTNREPVRQFKKLHSLLGESSDYTLDARMQGNVGRFYNHSCDPNSFVQNVFIETHDLRFPVVAFFAKRAIAAMDEITWNYNYKMGSIPGRVIKCNCGAPNCSGRIL